MDRRDFLKQLALYTAGVIAAPPVFRFTPELFAAEKGKPEVVVGKGLPYLKIVEQVLEPFGGMVAFVSKGDRVVVKPNIGWDRTVEQGANTHPEVVKALVRMALDAGAKKVQVFDRSCNSARRSYQNSGILSAVNAIKDRRATCSFMDDRKYIPVKIDNGRSLKEWLFYKDALSADCYINVPVAKHHGSARLTMGLKNVMGVIGGRRGKIHMNLGQRIADLNIVIRPDLTVIDATRIMLRNGPSGGNLKDVREIDTVIASTDPVAADAFATTLFGLEPSDIPSTVSACKMGLGEMDLSKIKIVNV